MDDYTVWKIPVTPVGFCSVFVKNLKDVVMDELNMEFCRLLPQYFAQLKENLTMVVDALCAKWLMTYWERSLLIPPLNIIAKFYVVIERGR